MMIRFRAEVGLAVLFALLTVLTAIVPDWIEAVFRVDPDHGNGTLEWAIVAATAVLAIVSGVAARWEWLRLRRSLASQA